MCNWFSSFRPAALGEAANPFATPLEFYLNGISTQLSNCYVHVQINY
jgi:hypothetical protein